MSEVEQTMLADDLYDEDGTSIADMNLIPLDQIEDTPDLSTAALRHSMERRGQLQPVILNRRDTGGTYQIVDGRRRVAAARSLEWGEVAALVYTTGELAAAAMAVTANAIRSSNPLTDLDAIERLMEDGYSETQIAEATGLLVGTIRKRLKLARLPVDIRQGVSTGTVAVGVAERIASLPQSQQAALVSVIREEGRITGADVSEATRIASQRALTGLHDVLSATTVATPSSSVERLTDDLTALQRSYGGSVSKREWLAAAKAAWEDAA